MATALETIVKQLSDSGIVAQGKLENFIPPKAHPKNVEELVSELVKQNHLTKFQAQQVSLGRSKALILGNYTILDKIGAGGMGQVFKALHRRMERLVAIKMLPSAMTKDSAAVARFQREVKAAAKLRHPHIVATDDADEANGAHFLVMEYIEGKDLSASVKKNGPFPVAKAVNYILQAARGLEFAHKKGVVHRDIKPANLLLDNEGVVKILDMGLARIDAGSNAPAQAELTGTGAVMGTVDYMAPEQAMSTRDADARADIYSLGCSLHYLIAGKATYGGESVIEKLLAHREKPIPNLRDVSSDVSDELEAVFEKMVAKNIEDRYQTMTEVIADLEQCSSGQSTSVSIQQSTGTNLDKNALTFFQNLQATPTIQKTRVTKPVAAKSSEGKQPPWKNTKVLIGAGAAGFLVVLLGVWVIIRDKDGKPIAKVQVPEGGSLQVTPGQSGKTAGGKSKANKTNSTKDANENSPFKVGSASKTPSVAPTAAAIAVVQPTAEVVYLDDLKEIAWTGEVGRLKLHGVDLNGKPIVWQGRPISHSVLTSPLPGQTTNLRYRLDAGYDTFVAEVGLAALDAISPFTFRVLGDGRELWKSSPLQKVTDVGSFSLSVRGVKELVLEVANPGGAHSANPVWIEPRLTPIAGSLPLVAPRWPLAPSKPEDIKWLHDLKAILTLRSGPDKDRVLNTTDPLPTPPATIVGVDFQYELSDSTKITDEVLKRIATLADLEKLWFDFSPPGSPVTKSGLPQLGALANLRQLKLGRIGTKDTDYSFLRRCTQLEFFSMSFMPDPNWADQAAQLPLLDELIVYASNIDDLAKLKPLRGLKRLELGGPPASNHSQRVNAAQALAPLMPWCRIVVTAAGSINPVLVIEPTGSPSPTSVPGNNAAWNSPAFRQWVADTQKLTAQQQIEAVSKKLMELNPGFDGKVTDVDGKGTPKIANSIVTELRFVTDNVMDISPVRALVGLTVLSCNGGSGRGKLSDLSPLQGMPLTILNCNNTLVRDLSPLKGMKLESLRCQQTNVVDFSPIQDCKSLKSLTLTKASISTPVFVMLQKALPDCKIEWDDPTKATTSQPAAPVGPQPPLAKAPFDATQAKAHQETWAKHLGTQVETVNSVGAKMILIPPGEFLMGSTDEQVAAALKVAEELKVSQQDQDRIRNGERPQHRVVITKPLLMSATEVTVGQYRKFVEVTKYLTEAEQYGFGDSGDKALSDKIPAKSRGLNWKSPGYTVTEESPVAQVTWNDACAYCAWLSEQEQRTPWYRADGKGGWVIAAQASGYRLPTEAEWEYACRVGTTTQYSFGDNYAELEQYGWYKKNAGGRTQPVGTKLPNPFGLFDMHGNLQEWCGDFYDEKWYEKSLASSTLPNDPNGPSAGSSRVLRGGTWVLNASTCRSASRTYNPPSARSNYNGFRCVSVWDATADSRLARGTATSQPTQPWNTPAFQAWVKATQALPAEQQIEAVSKKLMELNPGFDGKFNGPIGKGLPTIDNGVVTSIHFSNDNVMDLSPLRALVGLNLLDCGSGGGKSSLSDLSPLRGMRLINLIIGKASVSDLSPLKDMKLIRLIFYSTPVSNLSPLSGMPLTELNCAITKVSDLSPLKGMPLKKLYFNGTPVTDASPLEGMNLTEITFSPKNITKGLDVIRQMKSLKTIGSEEGNFPVDVFWKKYDAGEFGKPITNINDPAFQQWMKDVAAMPAEKQVEAVSKKLMELNPGFDGKVTDADGKGTPKIENGVVTDIRLVTDNVTDISPMRVLVGLKVLTCGGNGAGSLSDLTPLEGMKLASLACNGTQVSDLSPLKGMPLTNLYCPNTQVSDLSPLESCKNLASLKVTSTKVTPGSVAALQKALPNCKIEWDDPAKVKTPQPAASRTK